MDVSENLCPVCMKENKLEAIVCGHCGAALGDPFMDPGASTKTTGMQALGPEIIRNRSIEHGVVPDNGIAIYIEGASKPAYVDSNGEFVLGRKVGTTSEGLFDLAPLGGYHMGLSRRHAVIRRTEHGYEVLDLGSANGTWLNDERLVPHKSYPLTNGSQLRLGRMRLYVLYRHSA